MFPRVSEFEKAVILAEDLNLEYLIYEAPLELFIPAIVLENNEYAKLISKANGEFVFSGSVEFAQPKNSIEESKDLKNHLGNINIMVLSPCIADDTKLRFTAHISNDITELLPYINAYNPTAIYNDHSKTLTFMKGHRMLTLYANKIAAAKVDDLFDIWVCLIDMMKLIQYINENKAAITPNYLPRKKPPVFEVFNCLPKTNCGQCPQKSCMAFAAALHTNSADVFMCKPILEGDFKHLQEKYFEMCLKLGLET